MVYIKLAGTDVLSLKRATMYFTSKFNIVTKIALPVKKKKITLLRSTHVHKKARTQLEFREYSLLLLIDNYKDTLLYNSSKSWPFGVKTKIIRVKK